MEQDWSKWNQWAETLIHRALEEHDGPLIDATVGFVNERLKEEVAILQAEIGGLRADVEILRTMVKASNIRQIGSKRDAA